jgi:hypothetical protein
VRVRKGRLSNIDTFVDIIAANFDAIFNFGVVSTSVKAGSTLKTRLDAVATAVANSPAAVGTPNALAAGMQYGSIPASFGTGGTLPRGKVLFGMARDHLSDIAESGGATWSVGPDGRVHVIEYTGFLPGDPVVITSATGMIGVPEATQQGIEVNCLLNPNIKLGTRIQLDNASINTTQNEQNLGLSTYSGDPEFFASTRADGVYRVLVAEHEGDTRGHGDDWLTKIVSLALDPSGAGNAGTVQAYVWQGS